MSGDTCTATRCAIDRGSILRKRQTLWDALACCYLSDQVGNDRGQGWTVDGCLAESPAEEAGILQGDLIMEIGASYNLEAAMVD